MTSDGLVARCERHACCIHVPRIEASPGFEHLAGEWHLQWMANDGAWFLAPPQGNVFEIRIADGADATDELAVDGVAFDPIRAEIRRLGLFPPC
jgi:hypothetical protein